jgi:hypothetical protein
MHGVVVVPKVTRALVIYVSVDLCSRVVYTVSEFNIWRHGFLDVVETVEITLFIQRYYSFSLFSAVGKPR